MRRSGGSISPSGNQNVAYASSKIFTIWPNTGYRVANVLVDGSSAGAVTSYTFTNVTAGHTIAAYFAANAPPVARISTTPSSGPAPLPVTFSGTDSYDPDGNIASYHWTFDDGTTSAASSSTMRSRSSRTTSWWVNRQITWCLWLTRHRRTWSYPH